MFYVNYIFQEGCVDPASVEYSSGKRGVYILGGGGGARFWERRIYKWKKRIILGGVYSGRVAYRGDSQLVPMSTRPMSTRTHVNSYPCQLVPPIDVNSYHK